MPKDKYGPFLPVVDGASEREKVIKNNKPARFSIVGNNNKQETRGTGLWDDLRSFNQYGTQAVQKFDKPIMKYAEKYKIDPDLTRAVMYAENARGHKMGLNALADRLGASESIMPMNIQKDRWASLVDKKPGDLYNSDVNIEASTKLLQRIHDRIDKPTPEKIGTLWNSLGREKTSEFGEYIGEIYKSRPWRKID